MGPNLPFLSAASNAFLKPGGLLKWKERLEKDARLSLPLIEAMKIARLTFLVPVALRLSSPKPRLRHGRRLALFFRPNLTLNLCTFSFALLLPPLSHLPSLLTFPAVRLPGVGFGLHRLPEISHFSVSQPKALRTRARGYLSKLRGSTCPEGSHSAFCSPFSAAEFRAAASNLSSFNAIGQDKIAYPMLKHLSRYGMDFLLHIFNLWWSLHSFPSNWKTSSITPIHQMGKPLDSPAFFQPLSLSPPAYPSFFNTPFYFVYSSFWSQILFSLPARPVSALDGLL